MQERLTPSVCILARWAGLAPFLLPVLILRKALSILQIANQIVILRVCKMQKLFNL